MQGADLRALLVTAAGALTYVGACGVVGQRRLLPSTLARKLMHMGGSVSPRTPTAKQLCVSVWVCMRQGSGGG